MTSEGKERRYGRDRGHGGGKPGEHKGGGRKLDKFCGPRKDSIQRWRPSRGSDLAGGSPDSQGEEVIPGHRPRRGDVEGSGGDYK